VTFARGLRSILRHDPDKIMVGEIRDQETAQIAINSALTGHLVFTTVHANNVLDVLGRFLNMGVEPYNFVSALNCILAQRLVRVICEFCRKPVEYPDAMLVESGLDPAEWRQITMYEGAGCFECGARLPRAIGDTRASGFKRQDPRDDHGQTLHRGNKAYGARRGMTFLRDSPWTKSGPGLPR